ncbi:hypothetical protein DEDE109153_07555 [Deinococcus deserti]|uniref:Uncharacterized protein n=1 Tax=Deinococcus deserti (strain DSM 17065 / CIP 109153 / LMG 22923 / VCD115) TaxID=546414 RepID=C1CWG6_DEIDV|nr:hypothetical protein [Deinococcus deserti]ACO46533.1 Hypothetical protein; putative membrane protein [Deinococcus deserti VCD115]
MNPVQEWDWKGGAWLLGALLLAVVIYQSFEAYLEEYQVPISVISTILLVVYMAHRTFVLWRQGDHRMALISAGIMAVVLILRAFSLLVMYRY